MKEGCAIKLVVVGTIALVALIYVCTLAVCSTFGLTPSDPLLSNMKDVGLVAIGSLGALLARTGPETDEPLKTEVTNSPSNPIPTEAV